MVEFVLVTVRGTSHKMKVHQTWRTRPKSRKRHPEYLNYAYTHAHKIRLLYQSLYLEFSKIFQTARRSVLESRIFLGLFETVKTPPDTFLRPRVIYTYHMLWCEPSR